MAYAHVESCSHKILGGGAVCTRDLDVAHETLLLIKFNIDIVKKISKECLKHVSRRSRMDSSGTYK
jgi:hypothetical protein